MTEQFPQTDSLVYLNHAAVGPWPKAACEAVERFARENLQQGAKNYPAWLATESRLRQTLKQMINAESTDNIALLKNTSEALSVIAYGLDWRPGDNVVLSNREFPSNRIVWESLRTAGVEVRVVDFEDNTDPETALIEATDRHTRLLSSSSVHYADGLRMDLERLGRHCRGNDILFCVDAIQSLGAFPLDAQAVHADFIAADGHKWMLGPEGLALFYCRSERLERLKLNQYGWHMVEHAGDFDRTDWQPAASARRFECGSPNLLGAHALSAALDVLAGEGIESVARRIAAHIDALIERIGRLPGAGVVTPLDPGRRAGILTVRFDGADHARLHRHLMENDVICAPRGGGIRFSPHFYNTADQLERAAGIVENGLRTAG